MNILNNRKIQELSGKRLRRARRLYKYFIHEHFMLGDDRVRNYFVKRMKDAGLFSMNTMDRDVVFSVFRYSYKIYKQGNANPLQWNEWQAQHTNWRKRA